MITRPRTIITQDAEVDDQNSLRHFLFYANEVELEGIVQTSSKFHWQGIPGAETKRLEPEGEFPSGGEESGPYDRPYRWTGTDWMWETLDDYAKDYPNLTRHAEGYPTPEYLRSITKIGNVGYKGEMEQPTEGSELIRKAILAEDDRTLYLQVWGGCNTIARALEDIRAEYEGTPAWPALHQKICEKVVILACGEQDETYRTCIAEHYPALLFVKTLQMMSYAYGWFTMPEGDSKDCLRSPFMKAEICNGKSALTGGYCTWMDGHHYIGERREAQFGSNPNIASEWFGGKFIKADPQKYDFLSEGDSPTFFALFDWGFRTLEDFARGGMAGRYHRVEGEVNSKGEALNLWDVSRDSYLDRDGKTHVVESMWPYVADIQRDFAARNAWAAADRYEAAEHAPALTLPQGVDYTARPGETVTLRAEASSPDGCGVAVSFRLYAEASAPCAAEAVLAADGCTARLTVPAAARPGDVLQVIVKAQADGHFRLVHYQQVLVTVM